MLVRLFGIAGTEKCDDLLNPGHHPPQIAFEADQDVYEDIGGFPCRDADSFFGIVSQERAVGIGEALDFIVVRLDFYDDPLFRQVFLLDLGNQLQQRMRLLLDLHCRSV